MAWTTDGADRPGRVGSLFVGLRHVTDTGYRYDGEQPDPTRFAPAVEARSELHVWAVALGAGRCAATWDEIEAALEAAVDDDDALDGHVRQLALPLEGASDDAVFRAVGTSVDLALLATEEDVRRELIGRVSELLDAVLARA